jgi:ParB family chromosome partitioning protein
MTVTVESTDPQHEHTAPAEVDPAVADHDPAIIPEQAGAPADAQPMSAEERAAEIDTIVHADPNDVVIQNNVRTHGLELDKKTVANYQNRGIRSAINGFRREDGVIVITEGQLRVLHAREAGTTVPVWMKHPPSEDETAAEIKRVFDQLDENDHRRNLTHRDVADAHQYLLDLGVSPAKIARERGKSRREIQASVDLASAELTVKAADRYGLDLLQAAEITWFEQQGLLENVKELILTAVEHPNNFKALAQRRRNDHAEDLATRELTEAVTTELTAAGVPILDRSTRKYEGDARPLDLLRPTPEADRGAELTADSHTGCPGHAAWIVKKDVDDGPADGPGFVVTARYACTDFRKHGHALGDAPAGKVDHSGSSSPNNKSQSPADQQAREAARIIRNWVRENNKDWDAAAETRREWLKEFVNRRRAPEGAQTWLAVQKARGDRALRSSMERGHRLAAELLGQANLPDYAAKLSGAKATIFDIFLTLTAYESRLRREAWRTPDSTESDYMQTVIRWGHKAHDVELKVITPEPEEDVVRTGRSGHLGDGSAPKPADDTTGDPADHEDATDENDPSSAEPDLDEPVSAGMAD